MNVLVGHRRRTGHPSGHRANEAHTGAHCVLEHIHSAMHCIACSEPFQRQQYRHSTGSHLSFTAVATAAAVPAAVIAEYYDMTGLVGKQKHTELVRLVWFDGPSYSICLFFRFVFFWCGAGSGRLPLIAIAYADSHHFKIINAMNNSLTVWGHCGWP